MKKNRSESWGFGVCCVGWLVTLLLVTPGVAQQTNSLFGVVDLHVDLPYQVYFKGKPVDEGRGRYIAKWLRSSGVEDVVLPLYVPRNASPQGPQMRHLEESFAALSRLLAMTPPWRLEPCGGASRVTDTKNDGPGAGASSNTGVRAHFAFEGTEPVGWDLPSVERWSGRLRFYGLVHSYDTAVASSSGYVFAPRDYGLSRRGKELVRRIHATGGVVDVSHASDEAFADIFAQATAASRPMVATHSNARALAYHPRNLTDSQLRAIAKTGGVVGINFHSRFLLAAAGQAKLDDVVRHIRHAIDIAGIDHVGIGSDFEGGINPPKALSDVRGFPTLARALSRSGLTRVQIEKVFGLNARRVLCQR